MPENEGGAWCGAASGSEGCGPIWVDERNRHLITTFWALDIVGASAIL